MSGKGSEPVTRFGTCHQRNRPSQVNTVQREDCASSHTRKPDMRRSAKRTTVMFNHRELNPALTVVCASPQCDMEQNNDQEQIAHDCYADNA